MLAKRINIIPIIAKADSLTAKERVIAKEKVSPFGGFLKLLQLLADIQREQIEVFSFPTDGEFQGLLVKKCIFARIVII